MANVEKIIKAIRAIINSEKYIDELKRMEKYNPLNKRLIIMKLTAEESKMEILKQVKNLEGSSIRIDEDCIKEIQEE